jgi:hypothetical protein
MDNSWSWSKLEGETVSQEQYEKFKNDVKEFGIVRKIVALSDLDIVGTTLIGYGGVNFEMTESAWKNLVKLTGLSVGVVEEINKNLGEDVSKKLLNMMRISLGDKTDKRRVCMLFSKKSLKVVGFTKSTESVLSNNAFFTLFERTLNNQSGMEIKNMAINDNGNIELTVLNNNWEFNVGDGNTNLGDEYFKTGLAFINTPDATIINPFAERLVCTNGMITAEKGLSMVLKKASAGDVSAFFDQVTNLKGTANFDQELKKRIIRMMDSQASYDEMLTARRSCEYEISNLKEVGCLSKLEEFIPVSEVKQAFLKHNIDLNMLNTTDHKKIRTQLTVWDLVNRLTDLSSHPKRYGFRLQDDNSSVNRLQREAGKIAFKPQYDLESPVKQIF